MSIIELFPFFIVIKILWGGQSSKIVLSTINWVYTPKTDLYPQLNAYMANITEPYSPIPPKMEDIRTMFGYE
jgi:hypothetical protein